MNRAICIMCVHDPQFLKMASLCIQSMRKNKITEQVLIMTDDHLADNQLWDSLSSMNVEKIVTNSLNRIWNYGFVFDKYPELRWLINVDCDQYFHDYNIDFSSHLSDDYDFHVFRKESWDTEYAYDVLKGREIMFFHSPQDINILLLDHNLTLQDYEEWCQPPQRWMWGNFCFINRRILESKFWRVATRMGFIYPDDEGAFMLASFACPDIKINWLNESGIKQYEGPLTIIDEEPNTKQLVHYCGPDHKKRSMKIFDRLWKSYGN